MSKSVVAIAVIEVDNDPRATHLDRGGHNAGLSSLTESAAADLVWICRVDRTIGQHFEVSGVRA